MDAPIPWQQFMKLPLREAGDTGDWQINQQTSHCRLWYASGKQGVDAMTIESPNVKGIWTTIEVDEQGTETVLIVETDLELNAAHPAFDAAKVGGTSHVLSEDEARFLFEKGCHQVVIGSGQMGNVHLLPEAEAYFERKSCEVLLKPTPEAIRSFNRSRSR
jgi:hypothetical protein